MVIYSQMHRGIFLRRPNRFVAHVRIDGSEELCHVRNTGRCRELLIPGAEVWCAHHDDPARKTRWSLITVRKEERLVNIDSQVPNRLAADWVRAGGLGARPEALRAEQTWGDSRFDLSFLLDGRRCFLEVKGVTLEDGGVARFPDAPTERGAKHLRGLRQAVEAGCGAYVLFINQMDGISRLEPNWATDPRFSEALCRAAEAGVRILALSCRVTPDSIAVADPVPVCLTQSLPSR